MEGLSKITDLVVLNLVTLVCCIPVVTAGAALTGMHYVLLKMARNEEGYIVRSFFKSFKENFLQATGMWLLFLAAGFIFVLDLRLTGGGGDTSIHMPLLFRYLLIAGGIYVFMVFLYAFPLLARFKNSVFGTLRNAAVLTVAAFPRTIGMTAATFLLPIAVWFFNPLFPLLILFGLSCPGYLCALLYNPVFKKIEANTEGADTETAVDEE